MPRHQLSKRDLLQYALTGALTDRGLYSGSMDEEEEALLDKDISEIQRRIKLAEIHESKKATT